MIEDDIDEDEDMAGGEEEDFEGENKENGGRGR